MIEKFACLIYRLSVQHNNERFSVGLDFFRHRCTHCNGLFRIEDESHIELVIACTTASSLILHIRALKRDVSCAGMGNLSSDPFVVSERSTVQAPLKKPLKLIENACM
jgi:hypothetical protein